MIDDLSKIAIGDLLVAQTEWPGLLLPIKENDIFLITKKIEQGYKSTGILVYAFCNGAEQLITVTERSVSFLNEER